MKRVQILVMLLFACIANSRAQAGTDVASQPLKFAQQMPKPPYDFGKYLTTNVFYPTKALENNVQGRVIVEFVVNEDGSASDFKVVRGISKECDDEALKVMKQMPPWTPGMQDGKPVRVLFNQPITFKIDETQDTSVKRIGGPTDSSSGYHETRPRPTYNLLQYLSENVVYPEWSQRHNVEGRVIIKFIVNEDGSISNAVVAKGLEERCDAEALRVISNMPPWIPGTQNDKPVKVYFTQAISFRLTR